MDRNAYGYPIRGRARLSSLAGVVLFVAIGVGVANLADYAVAWAANGNPMLQLAIVLRILWLAFWIQLVGLGLALWAKRRSRGLAPPVGHDLLAQAIARAATKAAERGP